MTAGDQKGQNRTRIAFLASGDGTTFEAVAEACKNNALPADVVLLIVSREDTAAAKRAQRLDIDVVVLDEKVIGTDTCDQKMEQVMREYRIDFAVLGGYIKKIGPRTLSAFAGKIVNSHPAPLPQFGGKGMYGEHVHKAVLAANVPFSAVTIHLVGAGYDDGPVIATQHVPILAGDDVTKLRDRVQETEKGLLITTLTTLASAGATHRTY